MKISGGYGKRKILKKVTHEQNELHNHSNNNYVL